MTEDMLSIMAAEWSCAKAIQKYAAAADSDDVELFLDAFTKDGVWVRAGGRVVRGHEEIRAAYLARPAAGFSLHLMANILIRVADAEIATATSAALVLKVKPPVDMPLKVAPGVQLGHFEDSLRRCDDGHWRISARRVTLRMDLPPE